jgi:hypothetical protein
MEAAPIEQKRTHAQAPPVRQRKEDAMSGTRDPFDLPCF